MRTAVAREVIEKLIDDLDGSDATETVSIGLDGTSYEIDLNRKNATALRKALAQYVKPARKGRSARGRRIAAPATSRKAQRDYDVLQLREWAGSNGVEVPARGRIPQVVVDQYKAAGGL